MNEETSGTTKNKKGGAAPAPAAPAAKPSTGSSRPSNEPSKLPPLFRAIDWWAFGLTTFLVMLGYMFTIAPDVTLEDSGELATGSFYAGVPHPPGYPFWTIYTWLFTKILPFYNIAWRVGVASAFAGAVGCGLIALVTSRGSSMIIESIAALKNIERRIENWICLVSGFVAGMLMGFNGYMWSQSVIVEVYSLSVCTLMITITLLLRWVYQPERRRYLYWSFFFFGLTITNHMSLLVVAMGIEILVVAVQPRLGRDLLLGNGIVYVVVLLLKASGKVPALDNGPLFVVFNSIGIASLLGCGWLTLKTEMLGDQVHIGLICGAMWLLGAAFYFYMPIAGMSTPPMNWGYPRTPEGFMHAIKRGQYESVHPTTSPLRFIQQLWAYAEGAMDEFTVAYLLIGLLPFVFYRLMQKRERSWLVGLTGIYFFLSVLLLVLLNPGFDRQSVELNRVFFTASHVIIAIAVGYGLTLIAAFLVAQYEKARFWALLGAAIAAACGLYTLADVIGQRYAHLGEGPVLTLFHGLGHAFSQGDVTLQVYGGAVLLILALAFLGIVAVYRQRAPVSLILALFAAMPAAPILSHWFENEQRNHYFGYWFGHDMFSLDAPDLRGKDGKPIYPNIEQDTVIFGGTDPGRFNPTYMIFCESFVPGPVGPKDNQDPHFDRRDCYLITQNALADNTYLNYIRSHYNRSTEVDPPFFQNFFHTRMLAPLDKIFLSIGDNIEKARRAGTSFFKADDFTDISGLAKKLASHTDAVSRFVFDNLKPETQQALSSGDEKKLRNVLADDLNQLIESQKLYDPERFKNVKLSDHSQRYIQEDPKSHTRIRWNRLLLEDAYPKEIAKSIGGVYPDLEIHTPSPEDSQRCFNQYLEDAQKRYMNNQLKPGEDFHIDNGRVQVSGQVAVMSINGLLTKVIFDQNPGHEFYVEESFPLEWMFPHLTPSGIIMKINRNPVQEITDDIVNKDHEFWKKYSKRMIDDWIDYDTPITNICAWAEKVYLRHDLKDFKGDRKFVRDDNAQKAFSKLRSSIGGIYSWRLGYMGFDCPAPYRVTPAKPDEYKRVVRECEFAFKQAFAFCPFSPEAVYRFVQFLSNQGRNDEAVEIAKTCLKLDPQNDQIAQLIKQIETIRENVRRVQSGVPQMVPAQTAFNQIDKLIQERQTAAALQLLDQLVSNPGADANAVLFAAKKYVELGDTQRLEKSLQRMVQLVPDNPEAWYDLAGIQGLLQRPDAVNSLRKAIELSNARLKQDPNARDLIKEAQKDVRFGGFRENPEFKKLIGQ